MYKIIDDYREILPGKIMKTYISNEEFILSDSEFGIWSEEEIDFDDLVPPSPQERRTMQ